MNFGAEFSRNTRTKGEYMGKVEVFDPNKEQPSIKKIKEEIKKVKKENSKLKRENADLVKKLNSLKKKI